MSVGYDFFWMFLYEGPKLVIWSVAIVFCYLRHRENPKGATYLGLAVLLQFSSSVISSYAPFVFQLYDIDFYSLSGFQYILYFLRIGDIASWILITMAVFARPTHYDYAGSSPFDDDVVSDHST